MKTPISIAAITILLIVASGCTRKVYVPVETIRRSHDTLHIVRSHCDTIMLRDSIHIHTRGDTVFKDVTRDRIRISLQHDTVTRIVSDTVVKDTTLLTASKSEGGMKKESALWKPLIWAAAIGLILIIVKVLKNY